LEIAKLKEMLGINANVDVLLDEKGKKGKKKKKKGKKGEKGEIEIRESGKIKTTGTALNLGGEEKI